MMRDESQVIERVRSHASKLPSDRIWALGLGMLIEDGDRAWQARRDHARAVLRSENLLQELAEEYEHELILVKGLEASMLYPSSTMRHFRDIDLVSPDPQSLYDVLVARGFRKKPNRRGDIDHHHLPPLIDAPGNLAVEAHHRVNTPAWAEVRTELLLSEAQPSRTGIRGILRPRDDHHALIMALHYWKGGLTRPRDLLDALLFAEVSDRPVEEAAASLGLTRLWNLTVRLARLNLFGEQDRTATFLSSSLFQGRSRLVGQPVGRLVLPYLVAGPVRVTRSHWTEYRLGRNARHVTDVS